MKNGILTLLIVVVTGVQTMAQPLIDREGVASFFSEAPMEDIEAVNKEVLGAIDLQKGTLAVSMFMKKFHFDKSLMEEHFNENYLESEQFPKATFKGVIKNFANLNFSKEGTFEAEAEGEMEIHGVSKPLTTVVKFEIFPSSLKAATEFSISIADHDIDIPKLVIKNIAEVVEVKAAFNFKK
ncbi:YceI-like domain-containing protein [Reichenbachiella faecimaris]|uniref:YceI-like domain-containing protein n=1 Tax=Reichenbachiella faecimaris TaxID=692418 RepID=A0A1W2G7Y7_REIFA|nr:YceI family protein [Reichenbachiella faecimaris]SMD32787.1 YceI-like domain-containing protein [Reichenbachiella faecimaris]